MWENGLLKDSMYWDLAPHGQANGRNYLVGNETARKIWNMMFMPHWTRLSHADRERRSGGLVSFRRHRLQQLPAF